MRPSHRIFRTALVYTALAFGANTAAATDIAAIEALRVGDMKKLRFHSEPMDVSQEEFTTPDGETFTLADWEGQHVVLNFWATWCAPCRKEMPMLENLQAELGSDAFEVVPIATGRNPLPAITRFFEEIEVTELPVLLDARQNLARDMAVFGLPVTVILNPEGKEIARMRGDAEWDSESAFAIIEALIEQENADALEADS